MSEESALIDLYDFFMDEFVDYEYSGRPASCSFDIDIEDLLELRKKVDMAIIKHITNWKEVQDIKVNHILEETQYKQVNHQGERNPRLLNEL